MNENDSHEHEWEERKQMVFGERENPKAPPFRGSHAYFIKKKCMTCSKVITVDYKVEK